MNDWRKQIAIAELVKQRIAELDTDELWPHSLPEVAATLRDIAQVEAFLGEPLDPKYREFLRFANGWKGFYHAVDLFGTGDLLSSTRIEFCEQLLLTLEPLEDLCKVKKADLLPIAVSQDSIDLFVISRFDLQNSGQVFWFAGQLIDRFSDFDEFFLAMIDYNRDEVKALEGRD